LGGQLGLVVGGQRDEFGSAPFEFGALFGPLSAELLGDLFALIARLLFALLSCSWAASRCAWCSSSCCRR
jgi:hypothetical protein